jgi:hypothetical protein
MKANNDKNLEKFTGNLMKETSLEKAPVDFTSKVMAEVLAAGTGSPVYKPLISKRAWAIIFTAMAACICYLIINAGGLADGWFKADGFAAVSNKFQQNLAGIKISSLTLYTVVLSTAMLLIQIVYLKGYLNKRIGAGK